MEFKFRAGDHRPPPPMQFLPPRPPAMQFFPPRPPAVYCFSEQGFPDAFRGTTNIITLRKPFDSNEEMHWEMELMRLREEILLGEIERERFLKEEARRELRLFEREMAIRGLSQSAVGYPLRHPNRWVAPPFIAAAAPCPLPSPALVVQSFHESQKMEQVRTSERLGFGSVAFPPRIQPLLVEDKKEAKVIEEAANERELIVLEKPVPNVFRKKRKAETISPSTNDIQPSLVKKTSKDEWSCALCEVTTPNERIFNEHLRGKKHTRKEASLRAQKESKVCRAAAEPLSKKKRKLRKNMEAAGGGGGAEGKETKDGETHVGEKSKDSVDMNALIPNFLKVGEQENDPVVFGLDPITNTDVVAKKFTFWCEKCKVGAYETKVMLAHVNGKKHQAKFQEANQTGEGRPL